MKQYRTYLLVLAVTLMSGLSLSAATSTWDGDTDSLWTTALNWDAAPGVGDNIIFPNVTGQTVDLGAVTYAIGTLDFNAPDAYTLGNGGLTLGGNVSQNGSGSVTLDASIDLGGANRSFGGSGSGVVTLNGPITGDLNKAIFGPGSFVIANAANTVDAIVATNGATLVFQGTAEMAAYPNASYFGTTNGYVTAEGSVIDYQQYYTAYADDPANTIAQNFIGYWNSHGIKFGKDGGTLLLNKDYPVDQGPTFYSSSATNVGGGTIVIGKPLPFTGDGRNGTNFTGPWSAPDWGLNLGPAGNAGYGPGYARRFGEGDMTVILTNGATAYLEWAIMTNGNLTIKGQPGGNSAVAEVDANGSTTNVGRFCIRGPHRGEQYAQDFGIGFVTYYARAFYLNQPYAMKFYDAVQVWERDSTENLACDISFEPGSSVDFCGGKLTRPLRLGYPQDASGLYPTNKITVKGGANLNLNLQLRTQHWEGNGPANGEASGVQVVADTYIEDNGQMKIYRSQTGAVTARAIEIYRPIIGQGSSASDARVVVELPYASGASGANAGSAGTAGINGVNFDGASADMGPACTLVVNGSTRYGLKVIGNNSWLDNLLGTGGGATRNRMESLSGSGGVLTIAATNTTGQMTLSAGPTNGNPGLIRLGFIGDLGHTYILNPGTITNFNGILVKAARVKLGNGLNMTGKNLRVGDEGAAVVALDDAATATMNQLVLIGDTSLEMGTAGGSGVVLNLANSSASAWTAGKTLTIANWNGSASGGGSDQIKVGSDVTGLTAGQLAQIKWINPYGGGDVTTTLILPTGEIVPSSPPAIGSPAPSVIAGEFVFGVVPSNTGGSTIVQCTTNLASPVWVNVVTNSGAFTFTNSATLPEAYYRAVTP